MSAFPLMSNVLHSQKVRSSIEHEKNGAKPAGSAIKAAFAAQTEPFGFGDINIKIPVKATHYLTRGTPDDLMGSVQKLISRHYN